MFHLLFDKSVSACGNLIIPLHHLEINKTSLYSYALLSELGHKGRFHKSINPADLYSESAIGIIEIAKTHLQENLETAASGDYFRDRYVYRNNLIIIYELGNKYFYDHYKADSLNNIAAPKVFEAKADCLQWIQTGLNVPAM